MIKGEEEIKRYRHKNERDKEREKQRIKDR